MTAVIIEDEIPAARRLEKLLKARGFDILTIVHSVQNALQWHASNNDADVVFLDVKLRDGNCFEFLSKVKIKSKLVFTTAFDDFALDAFDYNSIGYLLKPIDEKKLDIVLQKIEILKVGFQNEFIWNENETKRSKNSFLVSVGSFLKKIEAGDVIVFYSDANATFMLTNEKRNYIINSSLENLENDLNTEFFFRVNRKFIINKKHILSVNKTLRKIETSSVALDFEIQISKTRFKIFCEWFEK